MIELDFKTLSDTVDGRLLDKRHGTRLFQGVSIDTRTIKPSRLFVAIVGENDDGHEYLQAALKRRAAGLLVSRRNDELASLADRLPVVVVEDTHQAMLRLALWYRQRLTARFIAITGSNGKTTTKEIVAAMIACRHRNTYRSPGNLNNLYGLPLSIFGMPADSAYGVFELGISFPGEMLRLAEIIRPHLVLLTNVGPTHLETLRNLENVAEAKFELVDTCPKHVPVILNGDDSHLVAAARKRQRRVITYGVTNPCDFTARRAGVSKDGFPVIEIEGKKIAPPIFGEHQIYNLLAGYTVGRVLGLDLQPGEINRIDFRFAPNRGEIIRFDDLTIISDCYNANPASMKSGLHSFKQYLAAFPPEGKSVAIIGDMKELGQNSREYHEEIGRLLATLGLDFVAAVGDQARFIYDSAVQNGFHKDRIRHFSGADEAAGALPEYVTRGDIIFLKASRAIGLEKIIDKTRAMTTG